MVTISSTANSLVYNSSGGSLIEKSDKISSSGRNNRNNNVEIEIVNNNYKREIRKVLRNLRRDRQKKADLLTAGVGVSNQVRIIFLIKNYCLMKYLFIYCRLLLKE